MNELINQITQRTGISQNQAQQAVQVVIDFLKPRVPGPVAAQLDNFVKGGQGAQGGQGLGGMMGRMTGQDQPIGQP